MEIIEHYFNTPILDSASPVSITFNFSLQDIAMSPFTFTLTLFYFNRNHLSLLLSYPQCIWTLLVNIPCTGCNSCILTPRVSVPLVTGSRWQWPNLRFSAPLQGAILNPWHGDLCPLSHHYHTAPTLGPHNQSTYCLSYSRWNCAVHESHF